MHNNLLETLKIVDGEIQHLSYHQKRYENSLKSLNINPNQSLEELLNPPKEGIFRCRVVYYDKIIKVEYLPYTQTDIDSLALIYCDTINYALKYENREELDMLFTLRGDCDDILIVKNQLLRDTTRANIAFFDGSQWYTPKEPLLYGTTRARLLEAKEIIASSLHVSDLVNFSQIAVMNAMIGFRIVKNGIIS